MDSTAYVEHSRWPCSSALEQPVHKEVKGNLQRRQNVAGPEQGLLVCKETISWLEQVTAS